MAAGRESTTEQRVKFVPIAVISVIHYPVSGVIGASGREAHEFLAPVYNWLTEAFDTRRSSRKPKALLDTLR